jgi:diguanylate cyclase (GGDEF)-like protein/putative nucleotidyltransferase with HDIG domain
VAGYGALSRPARIYVASVAAIGLLTVGHSVLQLCWNPVGYQWFVLAALTLLSGSVTVKVPTVPATISVSETFVITSVLLFGIDAGTVTVALDGLIISLWLQRKKPAVHKALFNVAAPSLSMWIAAHLFYLLAGVPPLSIRATPVPQILLPLLALTTTYFLLNSTFMSFAVSFEKALTPFQIWRENFLWLLLNYFSGASVAAFLVSLSREVTFSALALIVPLLVISYLTYKTTMGRVEDAHAHLAHLNRLYLSTIETLAMAIDAKDQVTHGHIRRVQAYAIGLARALRVADQDLLRAIEAASLLHDMGKLAVPEYILNKPGKLTPAEFEKMKAHATVGADLLSAIEFPYPVVPIVRHHHENWDGTGYPKGLSRSDIPIGARILSVVDCFDALTSDRPYRPRLSDDDALKILTERRGSMYDPDVVDAFMQIHRELARQEPEGTTHSEALVEIRRSARSALEAPGRTESAFEDISASSEEMLTLFELARSLAGQTEVSLAGEIIASHVRRIVPASLCVLYVLDGSNDELVAAYASGEHGSLVRGLRIPLGQRLSGWVGANRQTILNSDAALDLGEVARSATPRLRACLSTPLIVDDNLLGTLSLYSTSTSPFTDDHRRMIETTSRVISNTIRRAVEFERARVSSLRDPASGLPNREYLNRFLQSQEDPDEGLSLPFSALFLSMTGVRAANGRSGSVVSDKVLRAIARTVMTTLRAGDMLFRYGGEEFVAVLAQTDHESAAAVTARVLVALRDGVQDCSFVANVVAAVASAPADGRTVSQLIQAAQARLTSPQAARCSDATLPRSVH